MTSDNALASIIKLISSMRFSRNFDLEYAPSQVRLDLFLLRLIRWGKVTNVLTDDSASKPKHISTAILDPFSLAQAMELVEELLDDILKHRDESAAYDESFLEANNSYFLEQDLPSHLAPLHAYIQNETSRYYQKNTNATMSISGVILPTWIVHDRNRFDFILGWGADTMSRVEALADTADLHMLESRRALCRSNLKDILSFTKKEGTDEVELLDAMDEAVTTEVKQGWDVCFGFELRTMRKS